MKKIISLIAVAVLLILAGAFWYFYISETPPDLPLVRGGTNATTSTEVGADSPPLQGGARGGSTKIIAIGDSLTAGYGLNMSESYPAQLEKKLLERSFKVEVINSGISGETSAGLLERIDFIKSQKPDIVLITIGGNDALRALPVENTKKNIIAILESLKIQIPKEKIFIMQIQAPGNLGVSYVSKFNKMYQEVADLEGINMVPFVVPEIFLDNSLMQGDGIHPNAAGYAKIIEKYLYSAVIKEL